MFIGVLMFMTLVCTLHWLWVALIYFPCHNDIPNIPNYVHEVWHSVP